MLWRGRGGIAALASKETSVRATLNRPLDPMMMIKTISELSEVGQSTKSVHEALSDGNVACCCLLVSCALPSSYLLWHRVVSDEV